MGWGTDTGQDRAEMLGHNEIPTGKAPFPLGSFPGPTTEMKAGISHLSSPNRKKKKKPPASPDPTRFVTQTFLETRAVRRPRSPGGQIGADIQQGRKETKPKTPKLGEVQRPRLRTRTRRNPKETDRVLEVKWSTQG